MICGENDNKKKGTGNDANLWFHFALLQPKIFSLITQ